MDSSSTDKLETKLKKLLRVVAETVFLKASQLERLFFSTYIHGDITQNINTNLVVFFFLP